MVDEFLMRDTTFGYLSYFGNSVLVKDRSIVSRHSKDSLQVLCKRNITPLIHIRSYGQQPDLQMEERPMYWYCLAERKC